MAHKVTDEVVEIDTKSSLLICRAIGDTLRKQLHPVTSKLPSQLDGLLQQLKMQDEQQPRERRHARS